MKYISMFVLVIVSLLFVSLQAFAQAAGAPASGIGAIWEWIVSNWGLLATVLLGLSESLALIPGCASNSILQLILNVLKALAPKKTP